MVYQPSPYLYASKWSKFFHNWISNLFHITHKQKTLNLVDLYELLPQYESAKLTEKLESNWLNEIKYYPDHPSLLRATIRTLGWKPFIAGLSLIPLMFLFIAQPLLLTFLMDFFEPCSTMPLWHAWLLVIACISTAVCISIIIHHYFYYVQMIGLQMRIAYNGLIYRKVLRLSTHSLYVFSLGKITNLLSNDASHIDMTVMYFNCLWVAPLEILIIAFFFWNFVKYITFILITYTLVLLLLNLMYGRLYAFLQTKMLRITDERIKIIAELIKAMRIVKMYCWETAFVRKIRYVRNREIIQLAFRSLADCFHSFLSSTYISLTFLLMFGAMWKFDVRFDTKFFAVAYSLLSHTEMFLMTWFTEAIRNLARHMTASKRIQTFLLLEESQRDRRLLSASDKHLSNGYHTINGINHKEKPTEQLYVKKPSKVECNLRKAEWQRNGLFSLRNVQFDAHPGDLICIIGPVGSGKSSLLQTLTGEIAFFEGKVRLRGSFCYVPQEPWIFSSTVKKNILFGKEYNAELFRRVIRATALEADFAQLSNGMNTIVGDQGVMLSGGQKARVNMARALYRDADIYLLDDPLSAVDVKVSKHLFERSIKNYLGDRICILVTHQIQFLQDATRIILLDNGEMVASGTYEELLKNSASFSHLIEDIHQHDQEEHKRSTIPEEKRISRGVSFSETDNEDTIAASTNIETKKEGSVNWGVYVSYLKAGAGLSFGIFCIILVFGLRESTSIFYNWWLANWSDDESHRHRQLNNCTTADNKMIDTIRLMNDTQWNSYQKRRFQIYSVAGLILLLVTLIHVLITKFMCLNAGRVLHNKMFQHLIRCPISFFDSNPVGRILNRFTKDMVLVDDYIPWTLIGFCEALFKILGVIALVTWLNPWSCIPAALAGVAMLILRHRFAQCSRDLKRLEGITRSPIYSYLGSTINGLKVIRSYHAEKICLSEFFSHVDNNTRTNYLLRTTNRWAAIRLDRVALCFIAIVTVLAMVVRIMGQQFSAADIALTLSYSLSLMGYLQWIVRESIEVESQMTSVERVLEYCDLDQEPPAQSLPEYRPPSNWPSHGQIIFSDVCMSHSKDPHAPLALNHITLTIRPTEKIGIVGRTGAGKSSFIQTLFRMGTLVDGYIGIDGIDISTIGLDDLRRRISIIPQDPVLFTGTMRSNLDQFGDYSDTEIWHALEQVQLKKLVSEVMSNGLDSLVSESGSNLSVGQKQLVCLARAILRKSKILVIDEATANVDNATDELIQESIREQFKECTVLTVAHRLRTVIDSDRILVLGGGHLLEFDSPQTLLADPDSRFSSIVEQTGVAEADYLRSIVYGASSNIQHNEEISISTETSFEDDSETNPLLSSSHSSV